ncbi:MAG: restriction endonuclease subunit S, partial [Ruminococcus sp.]|nr:restriction endonuclease subunit S [Ruminococcus sp.]
TIDLCNQIIEKLDLLVKARFAEMFGDICSNIYNYPIGTLSEYISFLTSGSRGWAKYCVNNGNEWFITIKNVKNCKISIDNMQNVNAPNNMEAKRTKVKEDDLLISITADLGRTGIVTKEIAEHGAYINQHLICIRLDKSKLIPLFVAYFLESASCKLQFESKNQTGVKAGLNFNSIKSLKLLIPPFEMQKQFANFVEQTEKSKSTVKQMLEKAEMLKKSLMQKYFR